MNNKEIRRTFLVPLIPAGVIVLPFWFIMGLMTFGQSEKQPLVNVVSVVIWLLVAYLFTRARMKK